MPEASSTFQSWSPLIQPLFAGGIGFGVAWLTHLWAQKREERRLDFEREQKEIERKLALKQDIYLTVASDFSRFSVLLGKLADMPIDALPGQLPAADYAAGLTKLEVVAPLPLLRSAQDVGIFIRSIFGQIIVDRRQFEREWNNIQESDALADEAEANGENADHRREQIAEMRRNLEQAHHGFRIHCHKMALEMRRRMIPLVREMRREFDTVIDMKAFEKIQEESFTDAERMLERMIANLDEHFGTKTGDRAC